MKRVISPVGRVKAFLRPLSGESLSSPPPGRVRFLVSFFIVAYLLWQLALPLSYYFRDDKFDERYAWRMFSAFGLTQRACWADLVLDQISNDQVQASNKKFLSMLENWRYLLQRNPNVIADKFLRTHCEKSPWANEITVVRMCPQDDGSERLAGYLRRNCKTGQLSGSLNTP